MCVFISLIILNTNHVVVTNWSKRECHMYRPLDHGDTNEGAHIHNTIIPIAEVDPSYGSILQLYAATERLQVSYRSREL